MKKHSTIIKNLPQEDRELLSGLCEHADYLNNKLCEIEGTDFSGDEEMFMAEVYVGYLGAYSKLIETIARALPSDRL